MITTVQARKAPRAVFDGVKGVVTIQLDESRKFTTRASSEVILFDGEVVGSVDHRWKHIVGSGFDAIGCWPYDHIVAYAQTPKEAVEIFTKRLLRFKETER